MIGPLEIVSEGSIGSNLRRIEATTGTATLARLRQAEATIAEAAALLQGHPRRADHRHRAPAGRAARRRGSAQGRPAGLPRRRGEDLAEQAAAAGGIVVARRDGLSADQLRELALQVRGYQGVRTVVLGGSPEDGKVALVAAVAKGKPLAAPALIGDAARTVGGGGGGKNPELAMAGGRDPSRLDEALDHIRTLLGLPPQ